MAQLFPLARIAPGLLAGLAACAPAEGAAPSKIVYEGVETRLLEGDLVDFRVALRGAGDDRAVVSYATCAAAQYALIRGYGFARHIRTKIDHENGTWQADAVYLISAALPRGLKTIDAQVTVGDCADQGIPTV
ncbi:hypothetical protein DFO80_11912 [Rhodobacter sp. 140A]|jgi:hypothetical protein|uniref:Lipoprotein n=2 Tax=root TaxID=1 RepID=A0A443LX56_9RHOB|nr:hypothetical protein [Sinirhodobacter huangdaonensis]RBP86453.1 hypothetical protein DFO80_11912 [Rhodobacter sp. 140A]RWR53810.1 hypothetical protein EOW66_04115 [Sinirhodobacter huangdaonensis]